MCASLAATFPDKKAWKKRRKQPERNLHQAVGEFLDTALPLTAFWFPVPNGAHFTSPRHAAMMLRTRQIKPGVPDICIIYLHRAIFVELKAARGTPTDTQRKVHGQLTLAGAVVSVCRSVQEVEDFLMMLQIPLRARLT